ncbi:MAG: glycosyltransferase family 1 protein [Methanosphaera sp.]|nr:glycosyltransferase family 1 protein [Methanosphaera sp.]
MKLLIFVTGRGTGGDIVSAVNIKQCLEERDIESEIVLDPSAPGYYLKNHNINWIKSPIPAAGGHAATKSKLLKAGIKTVTSSIKAAHLIRKEHADGVIGSIGGGCVIGLLGAKLAHKPSVGIVLTPTDTRVSLKISPTVIMPESPVYTKDVKSNHDFIKEYLPIKRDIIDGNKDNILDKLPSTFDPNKKSVLFASGSTLFDDMAKAARRYAQENSDVNIFLIGSPLHEGINEIIDVPNIMYLGYIDYIKDLYDLIDLAIITDDGLTLHETMACQIPVVVVIGVKYGRYHGLSKVFDGAVLESHVDNISSVVNEALDNIDDMKKSASKYSKDILDSPSNLVDFVIDHME